MLVHTADDLFLSFFLSLLILCELQSTKFLSLIRIPIVYVMAKNEIKKSDKGHLTDFDWKLKVNRHLNTS